MEMDKAVAALNALSHETRLAAYRRLVQAGPDGMSVGELRDELEVPPATLTAHLNVLRVADLVQDQREGRVIRVTANFGQMTALLTYLTENCCVDSGQCVPVSACAPPTRRGVR